MSGKPGGDHCPEKHRREPDLMARETSEGEVNGLTNPRSRLASRPDGADAKSPNPTSSPPPPVCRLSLFFVSVVRCVRAWREMAEGRALLCAGHLGRWLVTPSRRGAEQYVSNSMRPNE